MSNLGRKPTQISEHQSVNTKKKKSNREVPHENDNRTGPPWLRWCGVRSRITAPTAGSSGGGHICQIAQWNSSSWRRRIWRFLSAGKTNELLMTVSVPLSVGRRSLSGCFGADAAARCRVLSVPAERWAKMCRQRKAPNPPTQTRHYSDGNQH